MSEDKTNAFKSAPENSLFLAEYYGEAGGMVTVYVEETKPGTCISQHIFICPDAARRFFTGDEAYRHEPEMRLAIHHFLNDDLGIMSITASSYKVGIYPTPLGDIAVGMSDFRPDTLLVMTRVELNTIACEFGMLLNL